jgi:alkaline phosphatase
MKRNTRFLILIALSTTIALVLLFTLSITSVSAGKVKDNRFEPRNIIIMVPDGMGLSDVAAARIYKHGLDGAPLYFETLENIGYQRTYSANSAITDSAAAASAWACGEKFNNGEICYHTDGSPYNPSILELARDEGKATGLVATYTVTHATPAAFGAHINDRNCEKEIARQYIEITEIDVMLGGGVSIFNSTTQDSCDTSGNFIQSATQKDYTVVYTNAEMRDAVNNGAQKLLGLFSDSRMVPEDQRAGTTQPKLAEMTATALDILEDDKDGFFLLVEGSQIDGANHQNNLNYQINETLAFDDAVKVVLDWIDMNPRRKDNTLLIIVPDHDTGGFAINGPEHILEAGELVEAGWTTTHHTGVDTIVWSQGQGSSVLGRSIENTDIYQVMVEALKVQHQ